MSTPTSLPPLVHPPIPGEATTVICTVARIVCVGGSKSATVILSAQAFESNQMTASVNDEDSYVALQRAYFNGWQTTVSWTVVDGVNVVGSVD